MVLRFLRWHSAGHSGRLATVLSGVSPSQQVRSLDSPLVVRARRSANGGGGADSDPHIDAIVSDVVRDWERGNEASASDATRGGSATVERGT